MQRSIVDIVFNYFEQNCPPTHQPDTPMWFGRCGPLYQLKEGYRAFINNEPVNWIGYNQANTAYHLFFGNKDRRDTKIAKDTMVEFRLDRVVYEPVIS